MGITVARLTIHITFYCSVTLAFYCRIVLVDQSLYFQRCLRSPSRMSHTYRIEETLTLLSCSRLCSLDLDCMSVNYNELLSKCELNNKNCYFNTYDLEPEDGWNVYSAIYIKDCGSPIDIGQASLPSGQDTTTGSVATYTCDEGYSPYPTGSGTSILCEPTGLWSSQGFSCEVDTIGKECADDNNCLEANSRCVDSGSDDIGQRCHCKPRFEYMEANRTCEKVCEQFASTFTEHPRITIRQYNYKTGVETVKGVSLESCMELCLSLGDECPSFDFGPYCRPNVLSAQQAIDSDMYIEWNNYNLYDRDCL